MKALTARNTAWKTLNQCDILRHDTAAVLNQLLPQSDRPAQATDIVFGVIRNRIAIDRVLTQCAAIEPDRVKPSQWNLLRIGAYELVYAPQTADYAIVNEAVELASKTSSKRAGGFINAVLRSVQRTIENRQAPCTPENSRKIIPQTPQSGCLFRNDLLPDPDKETTQYFSTAYSLPQLLINEWLRAFGPEETAKICFASNRHPSVIAQPNTCITTSEALRKKLDDENIANDCINACLRIRGTGKINTSSAYLDGLFYIQDTTAAETVKMLDPKPGWTVLDWCAAPGGKCVSLAMLMQDQGVILASDIDTKRLGHVRENAKRMRLQSVEVVPHHRIEQVTQKQKRLDAIVLDVPCSNTGVLARRVEARWRWKPEAVTKLQAVQQDLLHKAAALARPGTKILYSTCSILPDENAHQVQQFLFKHNRFKLLSEKLTLPALSLVEGQTETTADHDGGYAAVMQTR
ncbi:MAG: transcription antitermination factor NusB [Planctomycetota bacterium]|jgi:16S rRNA (cytosine967-C5)-methyltransferase